MLGIKINVEIVDDDTVQEFEKGASGEGKQLMQRICHPEPEFSASGVCPECAAHWFRVFNPETMEGIDGEGKLPEVGWHQNCVCEDIIFTGKAGYEFEPKKFGEEFEERYKKGDISSLGKTKERLFLDGALSIKNLLKYNSQIGEYSARKLTQLADVLRYTKKSELKAMAVKLGYSADKIAGLTNKDLVNIILQKRIKSKSVEAAAKQSRISLLKLGGK